MFLKKKKEEEKKEEKKKEEEISSSTEGISSVLPKSTKIASRILLRPIITEKATALESLNKYVFEVSRNANKVEIKKAIKELYNVEPIKVSIINIKPKPVRYGKAVGTTKGFKKAIITLKKGEKIDLTKK
jgi:large subunit ribosomal protein L23